MYSSTAQSSFPRSRIDADTRATVEAVPGVAESGGIGLVQLGARVPGNGPRDLAATALFGYELAPAGVPDPPAPGEVYADDVLRADGIEVGMEILLGPARSPVTVIGFVSRHDLLRAGDRCGPSPATWRDVLTANRPDEQLGDDVFQALVVRADADADVAELADGDRRRHRRRTESLTITQAIEAIPGVEQQRSTFNQIIGVTIAIAVVVVALFFALLTVERLGLYGVLKALGARSQHALRRPRRRKPSSSPRWPSIVAGGLALLLDAVIPPGIDPARHLLRRMLTSAVLLLVAAVVGCAFSLRRVLRVDPASAIGTLMSTIRPPRLRSCDARPAKVYEVGDEEVVALDHADLDVESDEIVALVGPSGSGKTTLCSIAGGLLTPTSGTVVVGGEDISGYSSKQLTKFRQQKVGFVFQAVNLVPFLTARENLLVVDELGRRTGTAARKRADHCSTSSASPTAPRTSPPSSPADNASVSPSAER